MGNVVTTFVYKEIEEALYYHTYYSDLLVSHGNNFTSEISTDGVDWIVEFVINDTRGKNSSRNSKGTRHLPESSPENS